jgi:hypothetical protein
LLEGATAETTIAVVSAPSTFIQIKNLLVRSSVYFSSYTVEASKLTVFPQNQEGKPASGRPKVWLLEYDKRFEVFKDDFVFYDFKFPMKLPGKFRLLSILTR